MTQLPLGIGPRILYSFLQKARLEVTCPPQSPPACSDQSLGVPPSSGTALLLSLVHFLQFQLSALESRLQTYVSALCGAPVSNLGLPPRAGPAQVVLASSAVCHSWPLGLVLPPVVKQFGTLRQTLTLLAHPQRPWRLTLTRTCSALPSSVLLVSVTLVHRFRVLQKAVCPQCSALHPLLQAPGAVFVPRRDLRRPVQPSPGCCLSPASTTE